MKKMRFFGMTILAGMTVLLTLIASGEAAPGKSGLGFLKLAAGARATGMGEACTAFCEGVESTYWNPAGLALSSSRELTLTQLQYFEDTSGQYGAVALPFKNGRSGTLGVSVTRFAIDNIEARDAQAARIQNDVSQEDVNLQVSYGYRLGGGTNGSGRDGLALGLGVKRISEDLAGVTADAFAFDLGAQYRPTERLVQSWGEWSRRLSLGGAVRNLGSGPTFDQEETPLPRSTRLGLAYTHFLWGDALNFVGDIDWPRDGGTTLSGGAEFWFHNVLALRAGYTEGQEIGDEVRLGAGFRFQSLRFDYALARFDDALGDTHRFTLTYKFGQSGQDIQPALKSDLLKYHLSEAENYLSVGSYHEAVLAANRVLEMDPRNPKALQILIEAGEKLKPPSPLPEAPEESTAPTQPEQP